MDQDPFLNSIAFRRSDLKEIELSNSDLVYKTSNSASPNSSLFRLKAISPHFEQCLA